MDLRNSMLLANMMSSSGGGGTVGTPVVTSQNIFGSGTIINYMASKGGKYWFRGGSDKTKLYYSANTDVSGAVGVSLHNEWSSIIFGKNINVGVSWSNSGGDHTDFDIYDNDMTYIRTVTINSMLGSNSASVAEGLDYLIYNGYIYILAFGKVCKIQDNTSVTTTSSLTSIGDNAYAFGELEGNEVLVTFNPNSGNSGSKYYVAKLNLDTLTVGTASDYVYRGYTSKVTTGCVKFNNKYYIARQGTLYSTTDFTSWTQETYDKAYYKIFVYNDVCYTVAKDGIYTTTDFDTYTLWIATTQMSEDGVQNMRTAQAFDDALIFSYATAFVTEFVIALIE